MVKHTIEELRFWQSLPLSIKIRMSEERIRMWVREYGESGVYVSFSGGKDSTVLLDIVRNRLGYKDIPAVFVDTGLEYPEIREFVKTFDNVVWLKPKIQFRKVIETYGYPFISKEIAHKFSDMYSAHDHGHQSYFDAQLEGTFLTKNGKTNKVSVKKWAFLKDADFRISHLCCHVMKKNPVHDFTLLTGRFPLTGELAAESFLRTQLWLKNGCNMYGIKFPKSMPLAFWTEQDVLHYIKEFNIPICSVYGDIVYDERKSEQLEGQLEITDYGIIESDYVLKTTGCSRTGCMFCGFGCHLERDGLGRFELMKQTHPKQYEWIMRDWDNGGLGYQKVIDWLNEHGNLNIRY